MNSGKRGTGGKHADYVQRSGAYENYKGGEELAFTESVNMPSWAEHDPSTFFRQADLHERANGSSYREFEFAIPREFTPEQRIEFVREFVQQEIGAKHPCTWAIHQPKSALTSTEQPHAHVMFSERTLDGIERNPEQFFKRANTKHPELGGCAKSKNYSGGKVAAERKEAITAVRERFATLQNKQLAQHGHNARVTHLSLEAQGIERQPEKHLGPVAARIEENIVAVLQYRGASRKNEYAQAEVRQIDVTSSLAAALNERKEHARIRSAAFDRIGANLSAADRVGAGAGSDYQRLERTGGRVAEAGRGQHARRAGEVAQALGAAIGRTLPEIARATERLEAIAQAQRIEPHQTAVAVAHRAEMQRAADMIAKARAARPVGPNPLSHYHPDNIAKREAEAAGKKARPLAVKVSEVEARLDAAGLTPEQRAIVAARVQEITAKERTRESASQPAPERDYRKELIAEVLRLTGSLAEIGQKALAYMSGAVFAVNEKFAAMHLGRSSVQIIDRVELPVDLGNWSVKNDKLERKPLSVSGLQSAFGKGVLAQD